MTSLFSPFDIGLFSFSYLFMYLLVFSCLGFFNLISSNSNLVLLVVEFLSKFFLSLKPKKFNKTSLLILISFFFMLMLINFSSVFPFNFPFTSQASLVLYLALSIWLSLLLFSFSKNFKGTFSHFIPEGTPMPLTFLLFLIELVSNIIRPITLTVRLVANILAGHLLLILLSSLVFLVPLTLPLYLGLSTVELFVALIQSYIFTTMITLYFAEV